ncbi:MAG: hypothetical protein B7Z80_08625 [Rhodospirillales bacterium 20-64-7]|nr:MAG: hypothetical protein B7Z80_08625 [Rhodospirillales bacterium 20-64-7]
MGIFEAYRNRRKDLSAPESVATLSYMEEYFGNSENWTQGVYRKGDARCLAAAAEYVRVSSIDDAKHWLRQAIAESTGGQVATIEEFNDSRSFAEVAAVVARARQLATANLPVPVRPRNAVEIIPPARLASPQPNPWASQSLNGAGPDEWASFEPVQHDPVPVLDPARSLRRSLAHWVMNALED